MTETQLRVLRPLLDRIIPADDFSSATEAEVDTYVLRLLDTDLEYKRDQIEAGLDNLDAEARAQFNGGFAELTPEQQDQLLKTLEAGDGKTAWANDPKASAQETSSAKIGGAKISDVRITDTKAAGEKITAAKTWFAAMIALAMEGFYSDPGNGGNKNEVSWKMVGYDPGAARHA